MIKDADIELVKDLTWLAKNIETMSLSEKHFIRASLTLFDKVDGDDEYDKNEEFGKNVDWFTDREPVVSERDSITTRQDICTHRLVYTRD